MLYFVPNNQICNLERAPPDKQVLIYGGKLLQDGSRLDQCNIPNESTLHLALGLAGGGCAHSTKKEEDGLGEVTFHDIDVGGKEPTEPVSSFTVQAYRVPAQPLLCNL